MNLPTKNPHPTVPANSAPLDASTAFYPVFDAEWLAALESSLLAAQKAVLAGNFQALDAATCEQARFITAGQLRSGEHADWLLQRAAVERVLHLGRVQAALLRRAGRALVVRSNQRAGTSRSYGPQTARRAWADSPPVLEGPACRV